MSDEPQQITTTVGHRSEVDANFFAPDTVESYTGDQIPVDPLAWRSAYPDAGVGEIPKTLTMADLLLVQILAELRGDRSTRFLRTAGINQTAAGYTKIVAPPSANQYIKIVTVLLSIDAAGTFKFVEGSPGAATDPGVGGGMGAMTLATGGGFALHAPNPDRDPLFVTDNGMTLGIVTATGKVSGLVSYLISADHD